MKLRFELEAFEIGWDSVDNTEYVKEEDRTTGKHILSLESIVLGGNEPSSLAWIVVQLDSNNTESRLLIDLDDLRQAMFALQSRRERFK